MEFGPIHAHSTFPISDGFFFALLAAGTLYGLAAIFQLARLAAASLFGRSLRRRRPSMESLKIFTIAALAIGLAGTLGEIFEAQGFAGSPPQPIESLIAELSAGYFNRGALAFLLLLMAHELWRRYGSRYVPEEDAARIDARSPLGLSPT